MKKLFVLLIALAFSGPVSAQEIDVPLFEDDAGPNLGRDSKPQDYIVLTPSQLPEVRLDLDNKKPPQEKNGKSFLPSESPKTPQPQSASTTTPLPRRPISLSSQYSQKQADELNQQLDAEIQRYQEAKAREEMEKAIQEAKEREKAQKEAAAKQNKDAEPQMPDSLAELFGKMTDVRAFDVSGFELGMTPDEVAEMATERGYQVVRVEHGIPLHRTSFYETNCRRAQVRRVEEIQDCIIDQAKNDEVYYISSMTLHKPDTAEKMELLFSSMSTDNGVYKIYYENEGDNSLNFTRKNLAKKIRRRDAFWKLIYDTYGAPDDRENMIWGDKNHAYMQAAMQGSAYNAYIILEDREPTDLDYSDAKEQAEDLRYKHPFTFATNLTEDDED